MENTILKLGENVRGMSLGVLMIKNAGGADRNGALKKCRQELEAALREKYGQLERAELKAQVPMDAYIAYYKRFGYTYHVLPQLESVLRGKSIPDVLPPVTAMFMAELSNMILTAGHDLDKLVLPLTLSLSTGDEGMPALGGKDVMTVAGDLMVTDGEGVISAVLRGCDRRTAMTDVTQNVLYTAYAPEEVGQNLVIQHLDDIESYVRLYADSPVTALKEVCGG